MSVSSPIKSYYRVSLALTFMTFVQRKDIIAPGFNVTLRPHQDSNAAPGYFFVAVYGTNQTAPYIYDTKGVSCLIINSPKQLRELTILLESCLERLWPSWNQWSI